MTFLRFGAANTTNTDSRTARTALLVAALLLPWLSPIASAQSGWSDLTFNASNDLTGVAFSNDTTGLVVGPNETIYRTTNGGSSFSFITVIGLDATRCCHSVRFRDASVVWIGGKAAMLRSSDGGRTFGGTQIIGIGGSVTRYNVFGISSTVGWQVGPSGAHHRYTFSSGGGSVSTRSWTNTAYGTRNDLHMFDPDRGLSVGGGGIILRISNGSESASFMNLSSGTTEMLNAIHMLDENIGWIAGNRGTILKTTNGGDSWSRKPAGTINDLHEVHFRDANIGWAVGKAGLILLSLDGGETWISEPSGTSVDLFGVHATANYAYAVGAVGTLLKRARLSMLISAIDPAAGPTSGGTSVTIRGAGFQNGATVHFGDRTSPSVSFVSSSMLTAVTPWHSSGTVDVTVRNPGEDQATAAAAFDYEGAARQRAARRSGS